MINHPSSTNYNRLYLVGIFFFCEPFIVERKKVSTKSANKYNDHFPANFVFYRRSGIKILIIPRLSSVITANQTSEKLNTGVSKLADFSFGPDWFVQNLKFFEVCCKDCRIFFPIDPGTYV